MEKWKQPANLGSCVWQVKLLQLLWKLWRVESSRIRARIQGWGGGKKEKKVALKWGNSLLEGEE